ncbi:CatA-like O-acetyltransferase [uncultured Oscillibacter sp.]|uniref:CatA-like O-acetyltransferase n=1 Tax=uncultured Oscillibacter sp. TaxID=876091 RepID=UPI0025CF46BD|nr:CatA-like O-acetyltransferase [uncultured Oscillibacter sp.]
MQTIPMEQWPRKELFDFFSRVSQPFYSVTFVLDVTDLSRYVKARGLSFYHALIYLSAEALDRVEAFRYALREGELVLLKRRVPSFTDLRPGSQQFHIVTLPRGDSLEDFCRAAREKSRSQTAFLDQSGETGDLIYYSCLPWLELTALTNERDFDPDDTVPRLSWGKFTEEQGRRKLHLSMEVNHRFIDGFHIGQFQEELLRLMAAL